MPLVTISESQKAKIESYTEEDFKIKLTPFYDLMEIDEQLVRQQYADLAAERAKNVFGMNKSQFNAYLKRVYQASKSENFRTIQLPGQPPFLCGDWTVTYYGIYGEDNMGFKTKACSHPILPKERLTNIDTGAEKMVLTFKRGEYSNWKDIIVEKSILASTNTIIRLADKGVDVTNVTARELVRFLSDIDNDNYDLIPQKNSVTRLGYIKGAGFSPYVPELVFDGDENYRAIFDSIKQVGSYDKWLELAKDIRKNGSITARIVLAASFASPLVKVCGALPFFVHLWGVDSGTGKTVALMLAASVWGNPQIGYFAQTFNSTVVGQEKLAAFLNHLPLCIDELQLAGKNKDNFDVYKLAEGVGKTRGTKAGGIERTPTWANTIITTGETPLASSGAGAGALNRVLDIECRSGNKVIEDGLTTAEILRANYGFAGKEFVEKLYSTYDGVKMTEVVKKFYREYLLDFQKTDTTEKQAMAAALILTADLFATDWIFKDGSNLTLEEIKDFLKSRSEVSAGERGYEYLCDFISENANNFLTDYNTEIKGSIYGKIEGEYAYIINSVFRRACDEGGFNASALISFLKSKGLIELRNGKTTFSCRFGATFSRCLQIKIQDLQDIESNDSDSDYDF